MGMAGTCQECGHDNDRARLDCTCPKCRSPRLMAPDNARPAVARPAWFSTDEQEGE